MDTKVKIENDNTKKEKSNGEPDKVSETDSTKKDKLKPEDKKKIKKKKAEPKFNILPDETKFSDQDKALNISKVFVERSNVHNDELIKYFLINNKIKTYECEIEKCPTKNGLWRRQPCYLELVRKNCKMTDLRISNLMFMCPNCYCQEKGPENFNIVKKKIEHKCISCGYILTKRNKSGLCFVCTQKINKGITNSNFTSYQEMAELTTLTSKTSNNINYPIEDYTDEIQAEIYEKYIKSANEIDFTKNTFSNTGNTFKNNSYSSSKLEKNKTHKPKSNNNIISQTEYSLEISSDLLAELEDI